MGSDAGQNSVERLNGTGDVPQSWWTVRLERKRHGGSSLLNAIHLR